MDPLLEYVERELNDGYSEAQVRNALQKAGYRERQIDDAIQQAEVDLKAKPRAPHEKPGKAPFYVEAMHYLVIFIIFLVVLTSVRLHYFEGMEASDFAGLFTQKYTDPCAGLYGEKFTLCIRERAEARLDYTECNRLTGIEKNSCLYDYAIKFDAPGACADVKERGICYTAIAENTGRDALCTIVPEGIQRDSCYRNVATAYSNPSLCGSISDPMLKEECEMHSTA
ncbi:MAG: hypothetical protein ABH829_02665 [archaeon]